ncbi:MAG TPA: hypothetical protein VFT69_00390 [Pseudolabrys sp.]|jgi:hypothetical protein|nr:hypothetical protein [Pseudolabrys sp.]
MRTLLLARIPTKQNDSVAREGGIRDTLAKVLEDLNPEAVYFAPVDGERTMIAIFDLNESSDLPRLTEPLFSRLGASVQMMPCMNLEDLRAGLSRVQP